MRLVFALLLLTFFSSELSFAKVRLNWVDIHTENPPEGLNYAREDFEKILLQSAKDFSDKYSDLGKLDIVGCNKVFELTFHSGDAPAIESILGNRIMDLAYFNPRLIKGKAMSELQLMLFHELSHFYDTFVSDNLERSGKVKQAKKIRRDSENRAKKKTYLYKKYLENSR